MLVALLVLIPLGAVLALAARLRELAERVRVLESSAAVKTLPEPGIERESPLQNVRMALAVEQDHPYPVLATLLKEALLREGARIEATADLVLKGEVVCNGYADVYFRADLSFHTGGELLFVLAEKPPHGDRQENLARELVARLRTEWAKRERHGALRELGGNA